jgi:hypothetical protein
MFVASFANMSLCFNGIRGERQAGICYTIKSVFAYKLGYVCAYVSIPVAARCVACTVMLRSCIGISGWNIAVGLGTILRLPLSVV